MNSLVPYELIVQGVLVFVVLLNWIFSFSSLKLFVLIIMGTHLAVQGIRSLSSPDAPARALSQQEHERVRCSRTHLHLHKLTTCVPNAVLPTRKSWTRPESGTGRTRMKCNDKSSSALFLPAWPFSASCIIWFAV